MDAKADTVHGTYVKKAKEADRRRRQMQMQQAPQTTGTSTEDIEAGADVEPGLCERKLDEYGRVLGLCFGAYGEALQSVHDLLDMAAVRMADNA